MSRHRLLLAAFFAAACDRSPPDLREWRAQDHDHTTNPGQDQVVADAGPTPELARVGLDEVTIIAWQQNCTRCHGRVGRGDGPQGAMLRPTDLTNPAWQRAVSDEQIAGVIKNGRGAMPPSGLPDATIQALVRLIRLLDASKVVAAPSASAAGSAAPPSASAAGSATTPSTSAPAAAPSAR